MDVQLDDRQVSTASGTLQQTRTAIESSFLPWTVSEWNNLPGHLAVPTQLRLSGPNWRKRLALRPLSLVATTTTIEMTADPLCHISQRFRFRSKHLKVATTHADLVLDKRLVKTRPWYDYQSLYFTEKTLFHSE